MRQGPKGIPMVRDVCCLRTAPRFRTRDEHERRYPHARRIVDNLLTHEAFVSVVPWTKAAGPDNP